ncbi:gamma-crystallin N isoform X2 [Colius striatus]|uniref:gamma-crystallin N isoform X2 n=1 Tax=Colius striatus TaxID=57412 RepID=UPI002B1D616A|nr:gamma-crystallin N isoform X2 [Colius striatus]
MMASHSCVLKTTKPEIMWMQPYNPFAAFEPVGHQSNPPARHKSQITLYEGNCFTGRKLDVCGSCSSFQDRGFLNRVNSISVQSGAWVCFDHPNFRGQQYVLEHGEYPDFYRWNGRSDHLGSCRPVGMHGENYRIEIFEGRHFSGPSLELTEDCSFLQGQGWDKTCINALKVYGDGACVFTASVLGAEECHKIIPEPGRGWLERSTGQREAPAEEVGAVRGAQLPRPYVRGGAG